MKITSVVYTPGAIFTLAEIPVGALFYTSFDETKFYPVVKEMTIQFLKPANTDLSVKFHFQKRKLGASQSKRKRRERASLDRERRDNKDIDGHVVALSRGIYQIRSIETGAENLSQDRKLTANDIYSFIERYRNDKDASFSLKKRSSKSLCPKRYPDLKFLI